MNTEKKTVKGDELKAAVLSIAKRLLDIYEEDIESGIEEGIYKENENVESKALIKEAHEVFQEFEKFQPEIYIWVEGGLIQGASANVTMAVDVFDKDNLENCTEEEEAEFIENFGTPEDRDKFINDETEKGNLIPVY